MNTLIKMIKLNAVITLFIISFSSSATSHLDINSHLDKQQTEKETPILEKFPIVVF